MTRQVELPDLGKLTKVRLWHEKRNPFAGWHLSKVSNTVSFVSLGEGDLLHSLWGSLFLSKIGNSDEDFDEGEV